MSAARNGAFDGALWQSETAAAETRNLKETIATIEKLPAKYEQLLSGMTDADFRGEITGFDGSKLSRGELHRQPGAWWSHRLSHAVVLLSQIVRTRTTGHDEPLAGCRRHGAGVKSRLHLLLPLVSALAYVVGALLVKRASDLGADVWRTARITNYISAAAATLLLPLGGTLPSDALVAARRLPRCSFSVDRSYVAGAQHRRRLSRHTGARCEDSACRGAERGAHRRPDWCATLDGGGVEHRRYRASQSQPRPSAPARRLDDTARRARRDFYACFDVLVQKWSPAWGTGRFLPIAMAIAAVYSFPLRRFGSLGYCHCRTIQTTRRLMRPVSPPAPHVSRYRG